MLESPDKRVELILQQLQQLPTLPAVALRVLEVTGSDESSAREVVRIIESDQSLTARILQILHRADTGVGREVATVERAVVLLGFDAVRSAALALSVYHVFGSSREGARFDREAFWKHSLAVACGAEMLAGELQGIDPSQAFVCGLLHDVGKVALDAVLPRSFERIVEAADLLHGNIADIERSVIGLDHMIAGKRLAERWLLPPAVRECIWLHGQNPEALPASVKDARLVNVITLADAMAREQHLGYSGNYTGLPFRMELEKAVAIRPEALERIEKELIGRMEQRAAVLGLERASSGELYRAALSRANHELGQVNQQLAAKSRRLAARARFFDALAQFQGELRPDAPPGPVLEAIAQTASAVLGVSPIAAFSAAPGQACAEVLVADEQGNVVATSVAECPTRLARPAGGDGPVLPAGNEMEWLLANISPHLSGDMRYWICLEAEGTCIGGVAWGAPAGEAQRLAGQGAEIVALAAGWSLALRTAQIREESHRLAEQLADANRQLQNAQAELVRRRALASVGELAAGAAHEMNNPLAVISGRSQLLAGQVDDPKLKQAAQTIFEQSHRLSQMITDLMEFARPVPPRVEVTDVTDLLERTLYEARAASTIDRPVELTLGEAPAIRVDAHQVKDALIQILHNAFQATDEKGGRIAIHAAYDGLSGRVVVSITDNGRGMDSETLKHAFDPFFSSQPAGRRRGLGLAKALRWIESSGGSIRLESHADQGTRATILLPAAIERGAAAAGRRAADA